MPAQLFHGWLSEKFGGKYFLGLGIFFPSVLTLLTPLFIELGDSRALIISRVLMGLFNSAMYPACSTMICRWTSPDERAKLGSFVYTGAILGLVVGSVLPAVAIRYSSSGWPAAFYSSGVLGVIWFPVWVMLCYNEPSQHPFISKAELAHLHVEENADEEELPPAPYKHIMKSKAFSAYVVGLIGSDWMFFLMSIDLPKYMSNIVRLPIEYNGYLTSLSFTSMWFSTIVSTWISDLLLAKQLMSLVNVRKFLGVLSLMGSAIFVLGASYAECNQALVVAMFVLGMTLMGTSYPSLVVNHLDLSPNYAGSLAAVGNGLTSLNGILAPYVVGWLTPHQTICEWRLVFWIGFGIALLSSAYYIFLASGDIQPWNEPNFKRDKNKKKRKKEVIDLTDC